ncbi:hypothetical protein OKW41_005363 [Paraburkholderia sp. UCT70]
MATRLGGAITVTTLLIILSRYVEPALLHCEVIMQVTGMLHGAKMLQFVDFPTAEVLGPDASEEEIRALIDKYGLVFIKPVFKGGVGKKGKSGLIGKAADLKTALKEKERLYFVEHRIGNAVAKVNGVTFEAGVPAEHEVYFSIRDSTHFRAPTMTLTHHGGIHATRARHDREARRPARVPRTPAQHRSNVAGRYQSARHLRLSDRRLRGSAHAEPHGGRVVTLAARRLRSLSTAKPGRPDGPIAATCS